MSLEVQKKENDGFPFLACFYVFQKHSRAGLVQTCFNRGSGLFEEEGRYARIVRTYHPCRGLVLSRAVQQSAAEDLRDLSGG